MSNRYQQRQPSNRSATRNIPEPEPGINKVEIQEDIPIFQLILGEYMTRTTKEAVWIDSGNQSSTYALSSAGNEELLHRVKVGRAFTAFQHYHITNRIEEFLKPETEYIILPNIDQQYKGGNISQTEVEDLFSEILNKLKTLRQERTNLKILYSMHDHRPHDINLKLQQITDNEVKIEKTSQGLRNKSTQNQQLFYRKNGAMQTTLPYWKKKNHRKPRNTVKVEYDGKNKLHI